MPADACKCVPGFANCRWWTRWQFCKNYLLFHCDPGVTGSLDKWREITQHSVTALEHRKWFWVCATRVPVGFHIIPSPPLFFFKFKRMELYDRKLKKNHFHIFNDFFFLNLRIILEWSKILTTGVRREYISYIKSPQTVSSSCPFLPGFGKLNEGCLFSVVTDRESYTQGLVEQPDWIRINITFMG